MNIIGFARQKKSLIRDVKIKKDKKQAILLLTTDEKGFTFKADGQTDIEAEEGDGLLTLKAPHKTQFLTITHPDYGQLSWRVPGKSLRKKKCYHAYLQTYNPEKKFKLQKQWVVFQVIPEKAVIHVDSTMIRTMDGKAQFHLPIGKHPYMVESPFYQTIEDTLEVMDDQKLIQPVRLQPIYSYLRVKTPFPSCQILIDNQLIGQYEAVSSHLAAGRHRLSVFCDSLCYYDAPIIVGPAEKKVVVLTASQLKQQPWHERKKFQPTDTLMVYTGTPAPIKAPVTIKTQDEYTDILLNRELVGNGTWEGLLEEGFYIINTRKDGWESMARYLWVKDEFPKEVSIGDPQVDFGFLNIHSNVMGANVYVNDSLRGTTPCIVEDLPAGRNCLVRLELPEYKSVEQKVYVLGNDIVDVELTMKKRKHDN